MNNINYYISDISDSNLALHIWDKEEKVIENRKKLASKLWFNLEDFVYLNQVHWNIIKCMNQEDKWSWSIIFDTAHIADACITNKKWIILSVLVADCVPIILYDDINNIIWVVHAWWKSTNLKIVKKTIKQMLILWATLENIKIIIWPSINECSFEVWEEVWIHFRNEVKTSVINNKQFINLQKENKIQAIEYWVKESNIQEIKIDTFTNPNYFSARRDWFNKGRFGAFIWLS